MRSTGLGIHHDVSSRMPLDALTHTPRSRDFAPYREAGVARDPGRFDGVTGACGERKRESASRAASDTRNAAT